MAGIGVGWGIFSCRQRRKSKAAAQAQAKELSSPSTSKSLAPPLTNFSRSIPSYPSSKSDFGKASTYFGVQVFNYSDLEAATNNFDPSRELGEGGFGTVYYGITPFVSLYDVGQEFRDFRSWKLYFSNNLVF